MVRHDVQLASVATIPLISCSCYLFPTINPFSSITTCRLATFLYGGDVVFTVASDEMHPTDTERTEFIMRLEDLDNWSCLSEEDLLHNEVELTRSSQYLQEFQGRLLRERYIIGTDLQNVRAVVVICCRPLICVVPGIHDVSGVPVPPGVFQLKFYERHPPRGT